MAFGCVGIERALLRMRMRGVGWGVGVVTRWVMIIGWYNNLLSTSTQGTTEQKGHKAETTVTHEYINWTECVRERRSTPHGEGSLFPIKGGQGSG